MSTISFPAAPPPLAAGRPSERFAANADRPTGHGRDVDRSPAGDMERSGPPNREAQARPKRRQRQAGLALRLSLGRFGNPREVLRETPSEEALRRIRALPDGVGAEVDRKL